MDSKDSQISGDPGVVLDTDIAPDGDVVLIVGPEKARLRVYSQCLRAASKVFNAMFGPDWSEGQGLSTCVPKEVALDEDNASALRTICLVLHHHADVPEVTSAKEIATIAVVSDKYDLAVALRYASASWLDQRRKSDLLDMGYRMVAAVLFNNSPICVQQSTDLVVCCDEPYMSLLDDDLIAQFIPFKTIYLLEQQRDQMRLELTQFLETAMNTNQSAGACHPADCCSWAIKRREAYTHVLAYLSRSRLLTSKLSVIIEEIRKATFDDERWFTKCGRGGYSHHGALAAEVTFEIELMAIKKRAALCTVCVRGGSKCGCEHK